MLFNSQYVDMQQKAVVESIALVKHSPGDSGDSRGTPSTRVRVLDTTRERKNLDSRIKRCQITVNERTKDPEDKPSSQLCTFPQLHFHPHTPGQCKQRIYIYLFSSFSSWLERLFIRQKYNFLEFWTDADQRFKTGWENTASQFSGNLTEMIPWRRDFKE